MLSNLASGFVVNAIHHAHMLLAENAILRKITPSMNFATTMFDMSDKLINSNIIYRIKWIMAKATTHSQ